jgi:glycosyltransferase involved in cell wall biosynthesis
MTKQLMRALQACSHDVELMNKSFSKNSEEIGKGYLKKLVGLPNFMFGLVSKVLSFQPKVLLLFLTNRPQSFLVDCCVLAIARIFRLRIVSYLHTNGFTALANKNFAFLALVKWAFKSSSLTITLSNSMTADVKAFATAGRVKTIRNCSSESQFLKLKGNPSRFNNQKLIFVSNLIPSKGYNDFLQMFYSLSSEFDELSGVMIGSPTTPDQLEKIRHEVELAGFSSRLKILGYQDQQSISRHLSESSVFVFPSQYPFEAQPLVLLEALAHALPIVAYSSGQIAELISERSGSRLVAPGDSEQLELETRVLLSDLEIWKASSELALMAFKKDFSIDSFTKKWQEALNEYA